MNIDEARRQIDEAFDRARAEREQMIVDDSMEVAEAIEYLSKAVKVKESYMNVNVDLCEDGTLWINDAKTDEQLAEFKVVEGE